MLKNMENIKDLMVERYARFKEVFKEEVSRRKTEHLDDIKSSLKAAKDRMRATTDATEEELEEIAKTIEKEVRETFSKARRTIRKFENQAWERPTQRIMNEAKSWLKDVSGKVKTVAGGMEGEMEKSMAYFTGEMVDGGEFFCRRCGREISISFPDQLPPCPECEGSVFRKR